MSTVEGTSDFPGNLGPDSGNQGGQGGHQGGQGATNIPQGKSRGMRLTGALLLAPASRDAPASADAPAVAGVHVVIDSSGIGVALSPTELPRVLPWPSVEDVGVESWDAPGSAGSLVVLRTTEATYRFALPGASPEQLGAAVGDLVATYTSGALGAPRAPSGHTPLDRLRPLLVALTIAAVAAIVAVILAQSAGAIHLSFLGGP